MSAATAPTTQIEKVDPRSVQTQDDSEFMGLMDSSKFSQLVRASQLFAASSLVPEVYRGNSANCFIVCEMAVRLGCSPLMLMQGMAVIHGKPALDGKTCTALINTAGLFKGSLKYEIEGKNPADKDYRVRAWATCAVTGDRMDGPWVDWNIVRAEGWESKAGSKWKTMPGLMFLYRSASFFGRVFCPERLMGMQTREEIEDVITVESEGLSPAQELQAKLLGTQQQTQPESEPIQTAEIIDAEPVKHADNNADTIASNVAFTVEYEKWNEDKKNSYESAYAAAIANGKSEEQAHASALKKAGTVK